MSQYARFTARLALAIFALALGAPSFAQSQRPVPPDPPTKEALLKYQDDLTAWGNEQAKTSQEFWKKVADDFYRSTKQLLEQPDLEPEERVEFHKRFAGILANYALEERENNGAFGEKYDELRRETGKALERRRLDADKESQEILIAYATQLFNARLNAALKEPQEQRDKEFADLVGDALTLALATPEFGETANNIVTTVRVYSPELGEEAVDAMCDAFEASGIPALVQPIKKTAGLRRYARLPGGELYFEAMQLDKGEFTKKFDWKEYEGKVVLVEVWATWCGPCKREIPRLKEAYAKYHDAGFEIVGYSIDQDVDFLKRFLVENEIPWPATSQKRSVEAGFEPLYDYYSINGVPEMILVGRDGKVVMTDCRGCKLADQLKELFPNVEPLDWDPAQDFSQRAVESGK